MRKFPFLEVTPGKTDVVSKPAATKFCKANANVGKRRDEILEQRAAAQCKAVTAVAIEEAITLQLHLQSLATLRDEARALGQYGPAIQAEKNRGPVMGYYVERHEWASLGTSSATRQP